MPTKPQLYNCVFAIKTLQANCQRPSCKVHLFVKINQQQRKVRQTPEMKKNLAVFNSTLQWDHVELGYDQLTGLYQDCPAVLSIHYETADQGTRINKLKIGEVVVNLGKLLNTRNYRINKEYPLDKCYDPNAKLKISVDLTQVEAEEELQGEYKTRIVRSSTVRTGSGVVVGKLSKIRQKMNEDEKSILQAKVYEYEDRLEKHRQIHNQQVKHLSHKLEEKEQKIRSLAAENSSLSQVITNLQLQQQRHRSRITTLEKQLLQCDQSLKLTSSTSQSTAKQLINLRLENETLSAKLAQLEQTIAKKEAHFRAELEKYGHKYMESENGRNRVVFELEAKMKEEMGRKDDYYREIVGKLEAKLQAALAGGRDQAVKKDKQIGLVTERYEKCERQRSALKMQLAQVQEQKQQLESQLSITQQSLSSLTLRHKTLESESEMSTFTIATLQSEVAKLRSSHSSLLSQHQQVRHQLQLSHRTLQQHEALISKLSRQVKTNQQREYYMEEKYQDELEMKSYNEECIRGEAREYSGQVRKLQLRARLLEEKADEGEAALLAVVRERERLEGELKGLNRALYETSEQVLRVQSENKKIIQKCNELEGEIVSKDKLIAELQYKYNYEKGEFEKELGMCGNRISSLEEELRDVEQRRLNENSEWEQQFEVDNLEKNRVLVELEREIDRFRTNEHAMKDKIKKAEEKQYQLQSLLREEREKIRLLQKQTSKQKLQLMKHTQQAQQSNQLIQTLRKQSSSLRMQSISLTTEVQKLRRKQSSAKQSHIQLIKWILDRNFEPGSREYLQEVNGDVEIELISFVNAGLQRLYSAWERQAKMCEELKDENDRIVQQLAKERLEVRYREEFGLGARRDEEVTRQAYEYESKGVSRLLTVTTEVSNNYEVHRLEEYKNINMQLQREVTSKSHQIESLNQQLFCQRTKAQNLQTEVNSLREQLGEQTFNMTKKTAIIARLQAQLTERDLDSSAGSLNTYSYQRGNRSPSRSNGDYRMEAEIKYKERKAIEELEAKVHEYERENAILKSKVELLESKLKTATERNASEATRITGLEKGLKEIEEAHRIVTREKDEKEYYLDKTKKDLELALGKLAKKQAALQQNKSELEQNRQLIDKLKAELEQWKRKYQLKQNQLQKTTFTAQKSLLQTAQSLAVEKMEREKTSLEQNSLIVSLKNTIKQAQRRTGTLEQQLRAARQESNELHQKILFMSSQINEKQEKIKDILMNQEISKETRDKYIAELEEKVQQKQFEIEELKFMTESKIMDLEKQLDQLKM